jgi:hypothetical protein
VQAWLENWPIAEAQRGNMEPLRKKYPSIAEFLKPPKRPGKGKRFPKDKLGIVRSNPHKMSLTIAVWDANRIRSIWKQFYKSKPKGYSSPEEIAARRWDVLPHHVLEWKGSRSCPRDPSIRAKLP